MSDDTMTRQCTSDPRWWIVATTLNENEFNKRLNIKVMRAEHTRHIRPAWAGPASSAELAPIPDVDVASWDDLRSSRCRWLRCTRSTVHWVQRRWQRRAESATERIVTEILSSHWKENQTFDQF